jgi:hypothetical protein
VAIYSSQPIEIKHIDAQIVGEEYHVFPGTTMTVCALKLRNGFIVIGESAAASPENFDAASGCRIARDNARSKIWALEGYLLRSKLSRDGCAPS